MAKPRNPQAVWGLGATILCAWGAAPSTTSAQCAGVWTRLAARVGPAATDAAVAYDASRDEVVWFGGRIGVPGVVTNETWVWGANRWSDASAGVRPTARGGAGMVFDSLRNRCVLAGGTNATGYLNDAWARTGGVWSQISAGGPTPARQDYAIAYDSLRDRVVLFGGSTGGFGNPTVYSNETWEFDGVNWALINTPAAPSARYAPGMAFDAARGVCVLYGGKTSTVAHSAETWEWNGATWTQRTPLSNPGGRANPAMTYDAARGLTVLFSGTVFSGPTPNDVWTWDGVNWTLADPSTERNDTPDASTVANACYDTARQRLFTRIDDDNGSWAWTPSGWTHLESSPSPATWAAATIDPVNRKVVLPGQSNGHVFGWTGAAWARLDFADSGLNGAFPGFAITTDLTRDRVLQFGALVNDVPMSWFDVWDGGTSLNPAGARPAANAFGAFAFDRARDRAVYVHTTGQTWLWDGAVWTNANVPTPVMQNSAAAYDALRQRVVLFGGLRSGAPINETWEWDGSAWAQRFTAHAPPGRSRHRMVYDEDCQRVFLWGGRAGQSAGNIANDAWSYDGADWTQVAQSNPPGPRENFAMAYDPVRHATILFGGSTIDRDVYVFSTLSPCPADTNGDRVITFADLNTVLSEFGQSALPGLLDGDVNDDGAVNFADLNLVLSAFGVAC